MPGFPTTTFFQLLPGGEQGETRRMKTPGGSRLPVPQKLPMLVPPFTTNITACRRHHHRRAINHHRRGCNHHGWRAIDHRRRGGIVTGRCGWRTKRGRATRVSDAWLGMAVCCGNNQAGDRHTGQHLADGGPSAVARAGGLQVRPGKRENHRSSQNHCFHN